jgi:uncharacterized membrane protein YqaE (UPF0057 family)
LSRSSFLFQDSRSTFLFLFFQDTRFLVVIIVVFWTGHIQPMALPFFLAGAWSARGGSLFRDWRVWISPSCQVMVGSDRWLEMVVFAAGETPVTTRVVHALPPVAVWLLPAMRTVLLLVVLCLFVYSLVVCVFHSVFVVHKYLLDLFVVWSFKGCSCNICVLFRQLLCQICL